MNPLPMLLRFLLDAGVTAAAGWLLMRALQRNALGVLERALGWLLGALLLVAGSAMVLGEAGGFGPWGFAAAHAFLLLLLLWVRRRRGRLPGDWQALAEFRRDLSDYLHRPGAEGLALAALVAVVAALVALAAFSPPLVYDALTYRLPRVGQWLQDGAMGVLATDDARLNYMSSGQDLVVAWLVGAFPAGFQFAPLAQALGGVLLLGATLGLARRTGLSRPAALGAAALLLGLANVAPQLTSAHTDLFAAGIVAASFHLLLCALGRGAGTKLGGAGLALALAAKGTVFYLLPSLFLWWLVLARRAPWRVWRRTGAGALLGAVIFLLPSFVRNHRAYGHVTAPADAMVEHYGPAFTLAQRVERLGLNLRTSLVQLLDPHSQPWGWRAPSAALAHRWAAQLPEHDPYAFEDLDRRANLDFYLDGVRPNADFAGPGVPLTVLFLAAAGWAATRRRTAGAGLVLLWAGGVGLYVLIQHGLLQWHPWTFRYLVLVAPWLVIGVVWLLEQLPAFVRTVLWVVLLVSAAGILAEFTFQADQVGWQAWQTEQRNAAIAQGWRTWAGQLAADTPALRVALPVDRPLAWFYRLAEPARVRMAAGSALPAASAEAAVAGESGWLVVPAAKYEGREGRVAARTWLSGGDSAANLSLAAYRALRPGELPAPVLYGNQVTALPDGVRHAVRLRSWQPVARLELANPAEGTWEFSIRGPGAEIRGVLSGHEDTPVEVPVGAEQLTDVTVEFRRTAGSTPGARPPAVVAVLPAGPAGSTGLRASGRRTGAARRAPPRPPRR